MNQEMPEAFWQAVAQFNQEEFYACHDTLEALWIEANDPVRTFYQGILQISVACYHLFNQNWRGATILLGEGMSRLSRYQPDYGGIDVTQLLMQSSLLLKALQQAGPEQTADLLQHRAANNTSVNSVGAIVANQDPGLILPQILKVAS